MEEKNSEDGKKEKKEEKEVCHFIQFKGKKPGETYYTRLIGEKYIDLDITPMKKGGKKKLSALLDPILSRKDNKTFFIVTFVVNWCPWVPVALKLLNNSIRAKNYNCMMILLSMDELENWDIKRPVLKVNRAKVKPTDRLFDKMDFIGHTYDFPNYRVISVPHIVLIDHTGIIRGNFWDLEEDEDIEVGVERVAQFVSGEIKEHEVVMGRGNATPEDEKKPAPVSSYVTGGKKLEFESGKVYEGEVKVVGDDKEIPHGRGRMTFVSGDTYEGDFNDGLMCGSGKYRFNDGSVFVGGFKDNMHGMGNYYSKKGNCSFMEAYDRGKLLEKSKISSEEWPE